MTPQVAMVAEREPELIIPESKMKDMGGGGGNSIAIYVDGSRDVDHVCDEIMKRLREDAGVRF
jgi:hypothetical protein